MRSQMKRLGVLAVAGGAFAATAALGPQAAIAQTSFVTSIVYASHDTSDAAQAKLACDSAASTTNCHIYVMNTDGAGRPLTAGDANDLDPAISPDGTKIAFARAVGGPQGGQYDIYVMDANGGNVQRLTTGLKDDRYPAWNPAGTRIAFRGYPPVGGASIFTMSPAATEVRVVQNTGGGDQPSWSPDGTRIAYSGSFPTGVLDPNTQAPILDDDIFVQAVDAGEADLPIRVTSGPDTSDRYPSWQPTLGSSQILFRRRQANDRELWRVDAASLETAPNPLAVEATNSIGRAASWSPDGAGATFASYFEAGRPRDQEIWLGTVNLFNNTITGARQLTVNEINDDEPKMGRVPVAASAVPQVSTNPAGGAVSANGTAITVGGGATAAGGGPAGRQALSLTLSVPKQNLGRGKTLRAYARCSAKCQVTVSGFTKLKVRGKSKTLRLLRLKKTINANVRTRLQVRLPAATLVSVRGALKRRKPVAFSITTSARTTTGESTPAAVRKLTLRK